MCVGDIAKVDSRIFHHGGVLSDEFELVGSIDEDPKTDNGRFFK